MSLIPYAMKPRFIGFARFTLSQALELIKQFETILLRDNLRTELESKYTVIFHNYGLDLETVQKLYDKQKAMPPMFRNASPVAGNIAWARHLLRRIEQPMKKLKANKTIMATKDSRKIIRTYNRVARALIEFETLWHQAWVRSIEAGKSGLQATLIVPHPKKNGRLCVNFDPEIIQLVHESKCLQRLGIHVPESAKMVLLQEDKFKQYESSLRFLVREFDRIVSSVMPVMRPLLLPHLDDLERQIQPGMTMLTWQSMNIDLYLQRIDSALSKFSELVSKITDVTRHRIEANIDLISRSSMVNLPNDQSFTLDYFVVMQDRTINKRCMLLDSKNLEVERAVADLVEMVRSFPLEMDESVDETEVQLVKDHWQRQMYLAILSCVRNSFNALKSRLTVGHELKNKHNSLARLLMLSTICPFFDVEVKLTVPDVALDPSLAGIQSAINSCALHVLRACKRLYVWGRDDDGLGDVSDARESFHGVIARDKEIVKAVLRLTGALEGVNKQINVYLSEFNRFAFLWQDDKSVRYGKFMETNPDLEAFDNELKKYMEVETETLLIADSHTIGCIELRAQPVKQSLKAEAVAWKSQYARNLHEKARKELRAKDEYMKDMNKKLNKKLDGIDLEDVRDLMNTLKEVRERETVIEVQLAPIEEMYTMLRKYDVKVPKDEQEGVSDLYAYWHKKVIRLASDKKDQLSVLQGSLKRDLVGAVKVFVTDVALFRSDFERQGPMQAGIEPMEAYERLKKYKRLYEERERKWRTYSDGEDLFGLPITEYPELVKTQKELEFLDR